MVSYSVTDGVLGGRSARLFRNIARCLAEILAILALFYSPIPLLCVLALEIYFAFRLDWSHFPKSWFPGWWRGIKHWAALPGKTGPTGRISPRRP
jgi:hypothetical protein